MARPFYNPRFHVNPDPKRGFEVLSDVVITEPDLAVTVEDIYSRFVRGMPITGLVRNTHFSDNNSDDDDDMFVDPAYRQNRDLTDDEDLREEIKSHVSSYINRSQKTNEGSQKTNEGSQKTNQSSQKTNEGVEKNSDNSAQ